MTGDKEIDQAKARELAVRVAAFLDDELARGADGALLAVAALGCAADLLRRTQSAETAAAAFARLAEDLAEMTPDDPPVHAIN
jgi:hypothetical protein